MKFRPLTLGITSIAGLLISCSPSTAKDNRGVATTADLYLTKPVLMRTGGLVPDSRKKALAISGAPLKVRAGNEPLSIDKALSIACGDLTELTEFYKSRAKELNGKYTHAEPGYSILVPFCIPTEFEIVKPNVGDTLEGVLKKISYIHPKYQPDDSIVRHLAKLNNLEDRVIETENNSISVPLLPEDSIKIPRITFSNPYAVKNEDAVDNLSSELNLAHTYTDFLYDKNTDLEKVLRQLNPSRSEVDYSGLFEEFLLANDLRSNRELVDYLSSPKSLSVPIDGERFFPGDTSQIRRASILVTANDTKESLIDRCRSLTAMTISCPSDITFQDAKARELIFWGNNLEPLVADASQRNAFVRGLSARTSTSQLGDELVGSELSGVIIESNRRVYRPLPNPKKPPPQNINNHFLNIPNTENTCQATINKILDVDLLIERYLVEYVKAKSAHTLPRPITIGIIDTGVGMSAGWRIKEDAFLKTDLFAVNKNTLAVGTDCAPDANCDIDNNFIQMDVYGASYNPDPVIPDKFSGNVGYHRNYLIDDYLKDNSLKGIYAHGTQVSSRAVGGMPFVKKFRTNQLSLNFPLRIRPVNITSSTKLAFADTEGVKKVINHLDTGLSGAARPKIINISYKVNDPPQTLDDVIKGREFLIVAAAGQSTKNNGLGSDLSDASKRHWPANMGGIKGDSDNVISVAASEGKDIPTPAKWADRGRHAVDLFAQGVNVPVWTPGMGFGPKADGCTTLANGSSFSAPQVSFASALVMHLGGEAFEKPIQVKSRILFSVNYHPTLRRAAKSSGTLNIIKSISLRTDVIQLSRDDSLVFGQFVDRHKFLNSILSLDNCTLRDRSLSRVKKISVETLNGKNKVIFWTTHKPTPQGGNGFKYEYLDPPEELSCVLTTQELDRLSFEFQMENLDEHYNPTSAGTEIIKLQDLQDIVFSEVHLTVN